MTDTRFVLCDVCGSEGRRIVRCQVYEPGCGFSHDGERDDGPCPECDGTGLMEIEVKPVTEDDLIEMEGGAT